MSDEPTRQTDRRAARPITTVVAAISFAVSTGFVVWGVVGGRSEVGPADGSDVLWRAPVLLTERAAPITIVAAAVLAASGLVLVRLRRAGGLPGLRLAQVAVGTGCGAWLGAGYRIVTAGTTGANIGGGLVILVTPILAMAGAAALAGLEVAARRRDR